MLLFLEISYSLLQAFVLLIPVAAAGLGFAGRTGWLFLAFSFGGATLASSLEALWFLTERG